MSHAPSAAGEHKPHILPIRIYAVVWIGLLILTVVTVKVSYFNLGVLNLIVAMAVATVKASLVVLFFMHLKYDDKFNAIVFSGSLAFLFVFFVLTLADTTTRGDVDPVEARTLMPVPARPELGGSWAGGDTLHGASRDSALHGAVGDSAAGSAGVADSSATHSAAPAESTGAAPPGAQGKPEGGTGGGH